MGAFILRRVKMKKVGSRQLLQSQGVLDDLTERAEHIAAAAGEGFEARSRIGRERAVASVSATTIEAAEAEATNRALTRAIDAGRDA